MLSFQTRQENLVYGQKALIVSPAGDIDKRSVRQFEKQMQDYYNIGYRFLILDCANIQSIGSEGLENILNLVETFQQAGGILLIVQALTQISRFFDLNGYSPVFTSFTVDNEAIQYLTEQLKQAYDGEAMTETETTSLPAVPMAPATPPQDTLPAQSQPENRAYLPTVAYSQQKEASESAGKSASRPFPQINIDIQYYKKMNRFGIYPLSVELIAPEKYSGAHTLNVAPLFPGCLSVPTRRTVALKDKGKVTFWLTPLTTKKMQAVLEFSKEQNNFQIPLFCKSVRQRVSKSLLLLAIAAPLSLKWDLLSVNSLVDKILLKLPFTFPVQYLGAAMGALFILSAFVAFLLNRARKAKPVLSKLNFQ